MFGRNKMKTQTAKLHFENKLKSKILKNLRMNFLREKLTRIKIELVDFIFQRKIKLKIIKNLKTKVEKRKEVNKICGIIKHTNFRNIREFIDLLPVTILDENDLKLIFALNYSRKNLLKKYFKYFNRKN